MTLLSAYIRLPVCIVAVLKAFFMCSLTANAQVSFSVEDTLGIINKTTITPAAYAHLHINNNTVQPLPMRWIRRIDSAFPQEWTTYFQDPATWHNPFDDVDSADFVLSVEDQYTNMLNFQVLNNGYPGTGVISFLVFPIAQRSDTVRVTYRAIITQAPLGLEDFQARDSVTIYPQPGKGLICVKNVDFRSADVFTTEGRFVLRATSWEGCIDLTGLAPAVYLLHIDEGMGHKSYARIVIAP